MYSHTYALVHTHTHTQKQSNQMPKDAWSLKEVGMSLQITNYLLENSHSLTCSITFTHAIILPCMEHISTYNGIGIHYTIKSAPRYFWTRNQLQAWFNAVMFWKHTNIMPRIWFIVLYTLSSVYTHTHTHTLRISLLSIRTKY